MADTLDRMLEPGEQVVWRDPRRALSVYFWPFALVSLLTAGTFLLLYLGRVDLSKLLTSCGIVLGAGLCLMLFTELAARSSTKGTIVTDRRILHEIDLGNQIKLVEVPLAEIATVELANVGTLSVKFGRKNGEIVRLGSLRRPQQLAAAAAQGAGLSGPALIGRLEALIIYCAVLGGLTGFWLIRDLAGNLGISRVQLEGFGDIPHHVLGETVLNILGFWSGTHLAALIAFAIMPRLATAEEARAWLRLKPDTKGLARLSRWFGWKHPLYVKLASLIYGEPMNGSNAEAAGHG